MGASIGGAGAATGVSIGGAEGSAGSGNSGCASRHSDPGSGASSAFGTTCATDAGACTGPGASALTGGGDGCVGTGMLGATASGATDGARAISALGAAGCGATRGAAAGFGAGLGVGWGSPATRVSSETFGATGGAAALPMRGDAGLLRGGSSRELPLGERGRCRMTGSVQSGVRNTSRTVSTDGRRASCNRTTATAACSRSEHSSETLNSRGEFSLPAMSKAGGGVRSESLTPALERRYSALPSATSPFRVQQLG